jgi:hypothetical protein
MDEIRSVKSPPSSLNATAWKAVACLSVAAFLGTCRASDERGGAGHWKVVEEFDFSWSATTPRYHFRFELDPRHDGGGECTRLVVTAPGTQTLVVDNPDGWVPFRSSDAASASAYQTLATRNIGPSRFALILRPTPRAEDPPVVFIRSWGYASNAERLHVLGFARSGAPVVLLNREFELDQLADLDGDGYPELAGWPTLSERFGPGLQSYDPPVVYMVPRPIGAPASLDLALSEAYAKKHYYGWVGLERRDRFVVVLRPPDGGKPRILPVGEAQRLMAGATSEKAR